MKPDEFNSLRKWFGDEMQMSYSALSERKSMVLVELKKTVRRLDQLVDSPNPDYVKSCCSMEIIKKCAFIAASAMEIADGYKNELKVGYENEV